MSRSLIASANLLKRVLLFLLFFYAIFGIMGLQFFKGSTYRRCVLETVNVDGSIINTPVTPSHSCGSYIDDLGLLRPAVNTDSAKGYACPAPQKCKLVDIKGEKPNGFINYDYIFYSMFSIFQSSTNQGWTQTMYYTMDAEYKVAAVYHVLVVVVIDLVFMNMFVAVIAETFSDIRSEYQEHLNNERKYVPSKFICCV